MLEYWGKIYGKHRKTPLCYTTYSVCWTMVLVIKLRQKQQRVPIDNIKC